MSCYTAPSSRSQRALGPAGALTILVPLAFVVSGCTLINAWYGPADPTPSAPPEEAGPFPSPGPLGAVVEGGRIEMTGSGFAITIPDAWSVELAEPDPDVFAASPGSAWEALRAGAPDRSMACSVAVGVAEVSLRSKSGTGWEGMTTPSWDPTEPTRLMVPEPAIPRVNHTSLTSVERLAAEDADLDHDVLYSFICADDSGIAEPEGIFEQLMSSFAFLPAPERVALATASPWPVGSPLPAAEESASPTTSQLACALGGAVATEAETSHWLRSGREGS